MTFGQEEPTYAAPNASPGARYEVVLTHMCRIEVEDRKSRVMYRSREKQMYRTLQELLRHRALSRSLVVEFEQHRQRGRSILHNDLVLPGD